ncbi:MAG: hypothetical protein HN846_00890 [Candidatus Pacebacteria bacterium]|jgi:hypothetical protein|nr:hypothetical protein [Candidatus Paceibacterota bacterium]MBT3512323.1 hypothetical protein [Candidatus Paceibacterota bacterium]MBT4004502.1 hypothetical protein [Candidatus Paceibacterota bacterium]MBT4358834.1 hypothetical protein [Candidatus Paceibacterota bacterium]MBT4680658.1 hypothetical protein [Candidatus Paceibacterota bacterium]
MPNGPEVPNPDILDQITPLSELLVAQEGWDAATTLDNLDKLQTMDAFYTFITAQISENENFDLIANIEDTKKRIKKVAADLIAGETDENRMKQIWAEAAQKADLNDPDSLGTLIAQFRVYGDLQNRLHDGKNLEEVAQESKEEFDTEKAATHKALIVKVSKEFHTAYGSGFLDSNMEIDYPQKLAELGELVVSLIESDLRVSPGKESLKKAVTFIESNFKNVSYYESLVGALAHYAASIGEVNLDVESSGFQTSLMSVKSGYETQSQLVETEQASALKKPEWMESLDISNRERFVYHENVQFFGDLHGRFSFPAEGEFAVYCGDILDTKHLTPDEKDKFPDDLEKWLQLVENDEAIWTLGNHDTYLMYFYMVWQELAQVGAGNDTYETLEQEAISLIKTWLTHGGGRDVLDSLGIVLDGKNKNIEENLTTIFSNPLLERFVKAGFTKGRLYTVVNKTYVSHTLPIADKSGNLLEVEDNLTGLPALNLLEERIASFDFDTLKRLYVTKWKVKRNGQEVGMTHEDGGPTWNREGAVDNVFIRKNGKIDGTQEYIDKENSSTQNLITQLSNQAAAEGHVVGNALFGHIGNGGTTSYNGLIINADHALEIGKTTSKYSSKWDKITNKATFSINDGKNAAVENPPERNPVTSASPLGTEAPATTPEAPKDKPVKIRERLRKLLQGVVDRI